MMTLASDKMEALADKTAHINAELDNTNVILSKLFLQFLQFPGDKNIDLVPLIYEGQELRIKVSTTRIKGKRIVAINVIKGGNDMVYVPWQCAPAYIRSILGMKSEYLLETMLSF